MVVDLGHVWLADSPSTRVTGRYSTEVITYRKSIVMNKTNRCNEKAMLNLYMSFLFSLVTAHKPLNPMIPI